MKITCSRLLYAFSLVLLTALWAYSSGPGSFDLSFVGTGYKLENSGSSFGGGSDQARDTAIQADGKIVVVGRTSIGGSPFSIALARYNPDGTFDNTFNNNGKVIVGAATQGETPGAAVAIQPDGKIVVVGYINIASSDEFLVLRFNTDGTPDLSFDGDGRVITPLIGTDRGADVAIQPDGKIIISGSAGDGTAMIRYNPDGSFDNGFGGNGNGIMFVPFPPFSQFMNPVVVQQDGKIIVAGKPAFNTGMTLVRYNANGTADTSFGSNSFVTTPVFSDFGGPKSLILTPEGKIVGSGFIRVNNSPVFGLFRYNADGSPDTTFDSDGVVSVAVSDVAPTYANAIALQADGKIVASGFSTLVGGAGTQKFAFLRLNVDGSLDTSFDNDGKLVLPLSAGDNIAYSVDVQADGKIIAAGYCRQLNDDFALVRLNTDGSLDPSFGVGGIALTDVGRGGAYGRDVVVQPDGKIVAAVEANGTFALARYNPNGLLDNAFGLGGVVSTAFNASGSAPRKVLLQTDGKIVVVGSTGVTSTQKATVVRYNANGSLDSTFDGDGRATVGFPTAASNTATSAAIGPDGKVVMTVFGYVSPVTRGISAIVRFNTDGSLDSTFGEGGLLTRTTIYGNSVAVQPDGKIVQGGYFQPDDGGPTRTIFSVARFLPDGSPDNSFDADGWVMTTVLTQGSTIVTSIALQPDGKIVAAGRSTNGSDSDMAIVRYNSNGSTDDTFGTGGQIAAPLRLTRSLMNQIALQSDGRIVAVAERNVSAVTNVGLARFNTDGSPDTAYGNQGVALFNLGTSVNTYGLALDAANNAIFVGGTLTDYVIGRVTAESSPLVGVSGRVTSTTGQGISNAQVTITDANNNSQIARTNAFGYYGFSGVRSNEAHTVRISSKRYRFQPSSQTVIVTGSLTGVDFVGDPGSESRDTEVLPATTVKLPAITEKSINSKASKLR